MVSRRRSQAPVWSSVLEVDRAKRRLDHLHDPDDVVRLLRAHTQRGTASIPPRYLNSSAFPSITGRPASGPMSPSPSTREPSETIAIVFALLVCS